MSSLVHLPSLIAVPVAAALALYACDLKEDGASQIARAKLLEAGEDALRPDAPIHSMRTHLCGFLFYDGEMERQVIAHRYVSSLGDGIMQSVIYDSDREDARLIGMEYLISRERFEGLPEDEKRYWHSHAHAVISGQLIAPRLPDGVENELMKELVGTYVKTWYAWQVDRGDALPLGEPRLMRGFTAEGQLHPELLAARDRAHGISSGRKKMFRQDLRSREVLPGS